VCEGFGEHVKTHVEDLESHKQCRVVEKVILNG